jgi:hypothetical protein
MQYEEYLNSNEVIEIENENEIKNEAFLNFCHTYDSYHQKLDSNTSMKELLIKVNFNFF